MIWKHDEVAVATYGECARICALFRERGFSDLALLENFFEACNSVAEVQRMLDALQREAGQGRPHVAGVPLPRAGVARYEPDSEPVAPAEDPPQLRGQSQPRIRHQVSMRSS